MFEVTSKRTFSNTLCKSETFHGCPGDLGRFPINHSLFLYHFALKNLSLWPNNLAVSFLSIISCLARFISVPVVFWQSQRAQSCCSGASSGSTSSWVEGPDSNRAVDVNTENTDDQHHLSVFYVLALLTYLQKHTVQHWKPNSASWVKLIYLHISDNIWWWLF